ncbi:hypothetical protein B0T18DRAFT_388625 [Schizothecium vesticola]|uniref:Uncharacterized protein n=1 Tax=Schizothecium vesticola TaxID=314040 RepID=A0AA40F0B3_9PEZI|nr:hypothetical protein B0T18DRAFT_388625 [Schizothecium vesticola]
MDKFKRLGALASITLWVFLLGCVVSSLLRLRPNSAIQVRADGFDGTEKPFDFDSCRKKIQHWLDGPGSSLNQPLSSSTDKTVFYPEVPANRSHPVITIEACQKYCDGQNAPKDDCLGRIKSWMYPVLFLIISLEPTIGIAVGVSALALYLLALGNPIAMFYDILRRISVEQHCRKLAEDILNRRRYEPPAPAHARVLDLNIDEPKPPTRCLLSQIKESLGRRASSLCRKDRDRRDVKDNLVVILSAMADLGIHLDDAKGRLCYALPDGRLSKKQKEALLDAAASVKSLRAVGIAKAWVAVSACILDFLFLIIPALQTQVSESPSGAKIASGTAFSWLIPLVILHAWYGNRADAKMSAKEIIKLLQTFTG